MWSLRNHWRSSPRKQPTASQHLSDFRFFGAQLVSRVQQALPINRMPVAPAPVAQAGYIDRFDGAKNVVQQFNSRRSSEPSIFPGAHGAFAATTKLRTEPRVVVQQESLGQLRPIQPARGL